MAGVLVGSAVLSGFFNVLFDRAATREFLNFLLPDEINNVATLLWELKGLLLSADVLMDDAEVKRILDKRVENWLTELKDVVFKAGEVVDKIETEALRLKMEGGQSTRHFSTHVKSELEEILSSLKFLRDLKEELGLQAPGRTRSSEVRTRISERPIPFVSESEFCGRKDIKETIMRSLRSAGVGGDKVSVIPVIGAGGIGKTTLVQIIYDHPEVEQLFRKVKAWITVSTEFDLPTITKTIIGMIADPSVPSVINGNENQQVLLFKLRDALKGKRFLLVLDDVWSENHRAKWESLKSCFKYAESGSKIIVTTRSREVALIMAPNQQHHVLQELPEKDCLKLFAQTVFDDDEDPVLQEIGKKIVHKCKGNPLSVRSVGGILRGERHPDRWEEILESSMWELLKDDEDIIPSLMLSYLYLPSEIKPCFSYCSIFPKDYLFKKEEVVRLWMAEGFLKNEARKPGITMEEVGKQYFEELISKSLFQRSKESAYFIMHDLVHDLAVNVSGEFCFCLEGEKNLRDLSCKTRYLSYNMEILNVKKFEGLSKASRLHSFVGLRRPLSPITPNKELDILKVLAEVSVAGACLQVLSLSRYYKIDSLRDSLGKLKHLRYLDLSHTDIRKLPDSVGTLYNLQTLLLRGCRNLIQLPESIGNLKQLRYLDLSNSDVRELPDSISTLDNLQTLLLSGCRNLTLLSSNQGSLINLHHLDISHSPKLEFLGNCRYGSLKDLKIVKCEALMWIPLDYFPKLNTLVLDELECLVELTLTGDSPDELERLSIIKCPKLKFTGNCRYVSLKDLEIMKCEALKSIPLDYFPKLNTLVLQKCGNFESFTFAEEPPLVLESLYLWDLPKFVSFPEGGLPAPNLKVFNINDCENLSSLPQHMHRLLPSLNTLRVGNCGEIESWPEGGLPSNLEYLRILGCKKLATQVMHWDLQTLTPCLKSLRIDGCGEELLDSFPLEGLFPTSLTSLSIRNFRGHKTLNIHAFQNLKELHVSFCDELQCLPEESLPNSLAQLIISECPLLERRYGKETGECWHKISYIPQVWINNREQHQS